MQNTDTMFDYNKEIWDGFAKLVKPIVYNEQNYYMRKARNNINKVIEQFCFNVEDAKKQFASAVEDFTLIKDDMAARRVSTELFEGLAKFTDLFAKSVGKAEEKDVDVLKITRESMPRVAKEIVAFTNLLVNKNFNQGTRANSAEINGLVGNLLYDLKRVVPQYLRSWQIRGLGAKNIKIKDLNFELEVPELPDEFKPSENKVRVESPQDFQELLNGFRDKLHLYAKNFGSKTIQDQNLDVTLKGKYIGVKAFIGMILCGWVVPPSRKNNAIFKVNLSVDFESSVIRSMDDSDELFYKQALNIHRGLMDIDLHNTAFGVIKNSLLSIKLKHLKHMCKK